jgi:hypothetical protein
MVPPRRIGTIALWSAFGSSAADRAPASAVASVQRKDASGSGRPGFAARSRNRASQQWSICRAFVGADARFRSLSALRKPAAGVSQKARDNMEMEPAI